jgi:nucleoside-diphosphate-sugar epimerase
LKLFVFGLGYSARRFAARFMGERIVGTTRAPERAKAAGARFEILAFDGAHADPTIPARLGESDILLASIAPGENGDPALAHFAPAIAGSHWRAIVYLSTVGVYGDCQGDWVDEGSVTRPVSARSRARLAAEEDWRGLGRTIGAPVHILRLAGIYGPGRNALVNLRDGVARRIVKRGQVFNRVHVDDIAQAIGLAIEAGERRGIRQEIWNVADDEPVPPEDVLAFAAQLLDMPPPPEIPFERAQLSPLARSFYEENRRVSNAKLKRELGFEPLYPTFREGLRALAESGEGRLA